jgi:aspartyl-tRNA(Asn)/glutamyl-tRNA(Gln) amidotransferase subunit C
VIDRKTVEHIAHLSRLEVSEKQAQEFSEQLSKILGYFEQISKVDTKNVEPLVTPSEIESFWREDAVVRVNSAEEMVQNAPERVGNLFKVPPVV